MVVEIMASANYELLKDNPKQPAIDYYFAGVRFLNQILYDERKNGVRVSSWARKFVSLVDHSYTTFDRVLISKNLERAWRCLDKGGLQQQPSFLADWNQLKTSWQKPAAQPIYLPFGHCLKTLSEHWDSGIWLTQHKLILGMVIGDIGAAIFKAKRANIENNFRNELDAVFIQNPSVKTILDLHHMFGVSSQLLLAGYTPKLLGSADGQRKAPDIEFDAEGGNKYYIEATRKEPIALKSERDLVVDAIKEKVKKVAPSASHSYAPCIISVDTTNTDFSIGKTSIDKANIVPSSHGLIYRGYADAQFSSRLQSYNDALSAASLLTAYYRFNGYGIAGVLVSRGQMLKIDSEGIAQAEGSFCVLHRDFETKIPKSLSKSIYIIDSSCIPSGFIP